MKRSPLLCLVLLCLACAPCAKAQESGAVVRIPDADHLTLGNGLTIRLAGIKAPFESEGAQITKHFLEKEVVGKNVILRSAGPGRYGETMAQVFIEKVGGPKIWLQAEMIEKGLAFAYPMTEAADTITNLLRMEQKARNAQQGLWRDPLYADTPSSQAEEQTGHYAFIIGRVDNVVRSKDNDVYHVNFGRDVHSGFTATVEKHVAREMKQVGTNIMKMEGTKVRIRGLVQQTPSSQILVTQPEQIEILE